MFRLDSRIVSLIVQRGVHSCNATHCRGVRGWLLGLMVIVVSGCGRYAAPVPPEVSSPKAVESVTVESLDGRVNFTWLAPVESREGKELERLDGYRILRKELESPSEPIIDEQDFDEIAQLPDLSIQKLVDQKEAARRGGKPFLRLKLADYERTVKFSDNSVKQGKIYMYKIVPYNHWAVEGEVKEFVRVVFRGPGSDVTILSRDDALSDLNSDVFDDVTSDFTNGSGKLF